MAVLFTGIVMEIFESEKSVHPFFEKRTKTYDDQPGVAPIPFQTKIALTNSAIISTATDGKIQDGERTARKPSPVKRIRKSKNKRIAGNKVLEAQTAEHLDVDPNLERRKRQKSVSPEIESHAYDSPELSECNNGTPGGRHNNEPETAFLFERDGDNCAFDTDRIQRVADLSTLPTTAHSCGSTTSTQQETVLASFTPHECVHCNRMPLSKPTTSIENRECETIDSIGFSAPEADSMKPKKQLRLNPKTGTIGSPPTKKPPKLNSGAVARKKPEKIPPEPKSFHVIIKYGHDRETRPIIGHKIDCILSSFDVLPSEKSPPKSPEMLPLAGNPKSTHPFFLGKAVPRVLLPGHTAMAVPTESNVGRAKKPKSTMTLGEAKSHSPIRKNMQASSHSGYQHFGHQTKILKFPGAVEACWPPKGMVHVSGADKGGSHTRETVQVASLSTLKKSKYTATETPEKESILKVVAAKLDIDNVLSLLKYTNVEEFAEPRSSLRLPVKHFENGFQLQRRIRRELSTKLSLIAIPDALDDSEDELHGDGKMKVSINPALLKIFESLPRSLTAFDRSQYETQSWIHKYSPNTAGEVLQFGKEPFILKEWLQSLTITAVDSAINDGASSRAGSVASRRSGKVTSEKSGKKKRKSNKLEGFVVSSDDEMDEMDEITDVEDQSEGYGPSKRTVIRTGNLFTRGAGEPKKLKNAAVISGPSGCGKTAMVYAVAKELGFEVFEINSSSRRSGKEILEKVGDMTRNHLVHLSDHPCSSDPQNDDTQRISDAFSADLKSGRQGTMNSFFKPKKSGTVTTKSTGPKAAKKTRVSDEGIKPQKAPLKQQTQSLILLEEVDVLFEEDKQFWTTVMNLISQSKRPIIMTCNDETLLPLQALELHAIIRLSPPPPDIAIDYMLLVAASEGHVIKRKAVDALYKARQLDLRASLTELNYWCQLGVGDRRGGLDWFYPRWPPGCDVDQNGHTVRVVSEGTYETGMGWLGRDLIFEHPDEPSVKEEILREAWDGWNIDIGDWHESLHVTPSQEPIGEPRSSMLLSYEAFAEAMSMADICACGSFATDHQVILDASSTIFTERARDDFTIGNELLDVDPTISYDMLNKDIAIWMKCQAQELSHHAKQLGLDDLSQSSIYSKIAETGNEREPLICRRDFSIAFDPIAEPERNTLQNASPLEYSVFDRTTTTIALDVAPYVRSIVAYDAKLQQERTRLSNLLSEGGRKGKRLRTTRSALSALEGGPRKSTRPEKYFRALLNPYLVNRTGVQSWQDAVSVEMGESVTERKSPALDVSESGSPCLTDSS